MRRADSGVFDTKGVVALDGPDTCGAAVLVVPGAHDEAAAVATIRGTIPLGTAATVDAVATALEQAGLVHLAAAST